MQKTSEKLLNRRTQAIFLFLAATALPLTALKLPASAYDIKAPYPQSAEASSVATAADKSKVTIPVSNGRSVTFSSRPQNTQPQSEAQASKSAEQKLDSGDYIGAIQVWSSMIDRFPNRAEAYLQRSILLKQIGDNHGALRDLDKCLALSPNHVQALVQRAMVKHRLGDARAALADADRAVELSPNSAAALSERSSLRFATGDMQGALVDYNQAATISPELAKKNSKAMPSVQGQITLGRPGQTPTTITNLDSAIQALTPANATATATTTCSTNSFDKCEKVERQAQLAARKPAAKEHNKQIAKNIEPQAKVGEAPVGKDKPEELSPLPLYSAGQLAHLNNTAAREINEKRFQSAVKTLTKLVKASPDYEHARDNLVIAHNNWGLELAIRKPREAAIQFRSALYLDPSQISARKNLNAILHELGHEPTSYEDRLKLAEELNKARDREGAYVELSEALKLRNTSEARLKLSQVILSLNQAATVEKAEVSSKSAKATEKPAEAKAEARHNASVEPMDQAAAVSINAAITASTPVSPNTPCTLNTPNTATMPIIPITQIGASGANTVNSPIVPGGTIAASDTEAPAIPQTPEIVEVKPDSTELLLQANQPKGYDDNFVHEKLQANPDEVLVLGRQLLAQGNYRDSENLLLRVKERSRALENEPQYASLLEATIESLVDLYVKTGQTDKAERYLSELAAMQQRSKHPDDPQLAKTLIDYARVLRSNGKEEEAAKLESKDKPILSNDTPELVP